MRTTIMIALLASAVDEPTVDELTAEAKEGLTLAERVFDAADPAAAYAALDAEQRAKVDGVTTLGELVVQETFIDEKGQVSAVRPDAAPSSFSGCYSKHKKHKRKALLGNTLYTYWQSTRVCVSNGHVTSVKVHGADGETSTPGWRIAHGPKTKTKNVGWEGRGLAKYYFVLGAGGWDIQHPSDCIQQRLNANGHDHVSSGSCDLG